MPWLLSRPNLLQGQNQPPHLILYCFLPARVFAALPANLLFFSCAPSRGLAPRSRGEKNLSERGQIFDRWAGPGTVEVKILSEKGQIFDFRAGPRNRRSRNVVRKRPDFRRKLSANLMFSCCAHLAGWPPEESGPKFCPKMARFSTKLPVSTWGPR